MRNTGGKYFLYVGYYFLSATLSGISGAYGQDFDVKEIVARYSKENSVILQNKMQLKIYWEDGKLNAQADIIRQRLLISELSPTMYNVENIYHSYFSKLEDFDAESKLPSKKGYESLKATQYKIAESKEDYVFYDGAKETQISFEGLVPNALTDLKYTIQYTDLHLLPIFYFQDDVPTVNASLEITVPQNVDMKFVLRNGQGNIKITNTENDTKHTKTYTWKAENIPKVPYYSDGPGLAYYIPQLIPFIASYEAPGSDRPISFSSDPTDLYHYYYKFIQNVNSVQDDQFDKVASEIINPALSKRDNARNIYQWVQKNIHYVAFEDKLGGFIPRNAKDICERKYGDCKDMTSILVALCRKAGIDAYFTWIGTRSKPYTFEETPLPIVCNHMICTIKLGDEWIFMDGTDPAIPFGMAPYEIQGKEAMIAIDEQNFKIITVPEMETAKNVTTDSTMMKIEDKDISGDIKIHYSGYPAWTINGILRNYGGTEKEKLIKSIVYRGSNKFVPTNFDYQEVNNLGKDAFVSSEFSIKDYIQKIDNEYYVNMNVQRDMENNWVDTKERNILISNSYKDSVKEVVILDIPKGYHVSYIPPNKISTSNNLMSYKISYNSDAKKVILVKDFTLNTLDIKPELFANHNKIVEELRDAYKESIVLTPNK